MHLSGNPLEMDHEENRNKTMAENTDLHYDLSKLKALIEKEEHEVKILEAQLEIEKKKRSRKRLRNEMMNNIYSIHNKNNHDYVVNKNDFDEKNNPTKSECVSRKESNYKNDQSTKDLLDLLDALGSNKSNSEVFGSLPTSGKDEHLQWEIEDDDDLSFRLLPLLGGIHFTHISHPVTKTITKANIAPSTNSKKESNQNLHLEPVRKDQYTYVMDGNVITGNYSFHINLSIVIWNNDDIQRHKKAIIERIEVNFDWKNANDVEERRRQGWIYPKYELKLLSSIAKQTRNVTQMFRNLVLFSEFDLKRGIAMNQFHQSWQEMQKSKYICLKRISATCFRLIILSKSGKPNRYIDLEWKYSFSLVGRGMEELELVNIKSMDNKSNFDHDNVNNDGLQAFVDYHKGNCEEAIKTLLHTISN